MYDKRPTIGAEPTVAIEAERWVPLAALAAIAAPEASPTDEEVARADLPLAYIPREIGIPDAPTFREVLERSVNWGRR